MMAREKWVSEWFKQFQFFPAYLKAIARQWMNILFGETILGVIFVLWWALGNPPLVLWFVFAVIVAGFFAWRDNHQRLVPRLQIRSAIVQHTPTNLPGDSRTYIQIIPECLTDSPVYEVRGHLLRVWKKKEEDAGWQHTEIDEPVPLVWSIVNDCLPKVLEPGVPTRLNLCWMTHIYSRIQLDGVYPLRWEHAFDQTEDLFRFDVRITAQDCSPLDASIAVRMGKTPTNTEAILLSQASI